MDKLSYARYTRKIDPNKEIVPKTGFISESLVKMNKLTNIIGPSVIKGARATFTPAHRLCFKVSVMTSVSKGPGDNPEIRPSRIPEIKNENDSCTLSERATSIYKL